MADGMDLSRYANLFLAESREHLQTCNRLLLELERSPHATEPVVGIFRAMHTLKGMSATMGYENLAALSHHAENLLALLRERVSSAEGDLVDLLFRAVDTLEQSLDEAVAGRDDRLNFAALIVDLDTAAANAQSRTGEMRAVRSARETVEAAAAAADATPATGRLVRVSIRADAVMRGGRAALALKRAEALGHVSGIRPAVTAFEQQDFDGHFSFRLHTDVTDTILETAIRGAGDIESVAIGEAPAPAPIEDPAAPGGARHIRVDLRRLDALMNHMGELVVAKGRLAEVVGQAPSPDLEAVSARIGRLVSEMQTEVIQSRLTPVWQVFDRYPRLVRDLARQLGKRVDLQIEGGDIELDRAILDEIGDPLLHLLRNAVDHGIESAAERRRLGKPEMGRIVLSAARDRSGVAVRVMDDGRGIDRKKITERAVKDGFMDSVSDQLTDDVLLKVLGRPGFSTAATITDVSGRGVGIDVVLTRVRALGGAASIESELGRGTTIVLRLPVTLAVLRVLLTRVGRERYAVPLAHVSETVEFNPGRATSMGGKEALVLRDRVIPATRLRDLLSVPGDLGPARPPAIILETGNRKSALVVDALLGQQEIVVEPFEAPSGMLPLFSGATILGDGEPALILDAAALV
ncbi:MAG: chemotaxis protein CheA [Gemmatimonadota bacterium]